MRIRTLAKCMGTALCLVIPSSAALSQSSSNDLRAAIESEDFPAVVNTRPVGLADFPTAETHHMMRTAIQSLDCFGKWAHFPNLTPIDAQNVVRMNRDTLYSSLVLDLSTPAILTMADIGDRYQSLLVVNEAHFAYEVFYEPGTYELTQEAVGSRYVAVIGRTLVDVEDSEDLAAAQAAQAGLTVSQSDIGSFDVPNWDAHDLEEMRNALKVLGQRLPDRDTAFGATIDDVDPLAYLIGSADAWGGWPPENAVYKNYIPAQNDGTTSHILTLKDVPSGPNAFWSVSVYNGDGFFEQNEYDAYVINSRKAQTNEDGSVTIHFGGDPAQTNFLPIADDWNYMLRIYLPQTPYFNGSWYAPDATPS